ncbi:hypothetical protein EEJ42_18325 [Streptomyces botrytidirepellens]|uniref:Uncharacterized protein n=1 Tax=Streptomyces botrytidirepellens TaxID=2486417 RepID=A0A3M8W0L3_9ACTN|nr:hypothetical protein EEJ42_18325 [Streptomyces botrytidirepellens]
MPRSSSGPIPMAHGSAGDGAEVAMTSSPIDSVPAASGPGPRVRTVGTSTSGSNVAAVAYRSASTSRMAVSTLVVIEARGGALMPYRLTTRAPGSPAALRAPRASAVLPVSRVTVVPRAAPRATSSWRGGRWRR